jgi:hypothetical protein
LLAPKFGCDLLQMGISLPSDVRLFTSVRWGAVQSAVRIRCLHPGSFASKDQACKDDQCFQTRVFSHCRRDGASPDKKGTTYK